jgi:acetoin utilization protein AcuB
LLVVERGKLIGVISDRDLLKAISPKVGTAAESEKDAATLNKRVHQIMTRNPLTLPPDATMMDAVNLFNTHRVSCIPIVNSDRIPVGVLSWRDILRTLGEKLNGEHISARAD